jgi:hypothetical protein
MPTTMPKAEDPEDILRRYPKRMWRKPLAEAITNEFFPVSHRSLEVWPLQWQHVNGKAVTDTREAFIFAQKKLDAAAIFRGGFQVKSSRGTQ